MIFTSSQAIPNIQWYLDNTLIDITRDNRYSISTNVTNGIIIYSLSISVTSGDVIGQYLVIVTAGGKNGNDSFNFENPG